ncbi:hypothetical protein BDF19DRAFT_415468 [Syncephalis fuscata]|nr:hypothetical protein BDF19DRAFT_415468 [Syncephalis fuscata]
MRGELGSKSHTKIITRTNTASRSAGIDEAVAFDICMDLKITKNTINILSSNAGVDSKTRKVRATVVGYDCLEFLYSSVKYALKLALDTTLDKITLEMDLRYCNDANNTFGKTIYLVIPGLFYDGDSFTANRTSFIALYYNLNAVLKDQPIQPNNYYIDEEYRAPQYSANKDKSYVEALLPLAEIAINLYERSYPICAIPNKILNLVELLALKK